MQLVVDASVAVKWLVREEFSDIADEILNGQHEVYAPHLLAVEVGNALWRKARSGEIERPQAGLLAAEINEIGVNWADDEDVCADAVRLALALNHPIYDCTYLALAHRIGAKMVTADERFVNAVAGTEHGGPVMELKDLILE